VKLDVMANMSARRAANTAMRASPWPGMAAERRVWRPVATPYRWTA